MRSESLSARLYDLANHTPGIGDEELAAYMNQAGDLEDLVAGTPCATPAGAAAQVEVAAVARPVETSLEGWPVGDRATGALGQVAALLGRLAGG